MNKSVKILLAVGAVALVVFIVCISLLLFLNSQKSPTWQEQYDLGIRYLSEGNYQKAIVAFTAAIEIDAMRPEAYLKAAEAYTAAGDSEAAKEILEKGYAATGDESLLLREETPGEESLPPQEEVLGDEPLPPQEGMSDDESLPQQDTTSEDELAAEWTTANFITPEELTFEGVPFYQRNINLIEYHAYSQITPEFRDIRCDMPLTEALDNLGFSPAFYQRLQRIYAGDNGDAAVFDDLGAVALGNYADAGDIHTSHSDTYIPGEPYIQCTLYKDGTDTYQTIELYIRWKLSDDSSNVVSLDFLIRNNERVQVCYLIYS